MKHVFDEKMRVSDELFHDEQRAHETARRLAEQNEYDNVSRSHHPPSILPNHY